MRAQTNVMVEIAFTATRDYRNAFREVTLDVVFETPQGRRLEVPAFWAGGRVWKVRYASPAVGIHRWQSVCSARTDRGLHGLSGQVTVERYRGENPLYVHGPLRVAADRRHFEHSDGINGRTQAQFPWWNKPGGQVDPKIGWFHDILHNDGTPYRPDEIETIRRIIAGED